MVVSVDDMPGGQPVHRKRARVEGLVVAQPGSGSLGVVGVLERICRAVTADLEALGAVVTLMSANDSEAVAASSDARSKLIDELQFTFGEGPGHDSFAARRPVLVPDLDRESAGRWPGFAPAASNAGVRAAYAFPLYVGAAGFGVLSVYSDRPGSLSDHQLASGLAFADIATEVLIDASPALAEGRLDRGLARAVDYRAEIYQAQGMVMVALGVGLGEAMARMRAHAFAVELDLAELSTGILSGKVRLEADAC